MDHGSLFSGVENVQSVLPQSSFDPSPSCATVTVNRQPVLVTTITNTTTPVKPVSSTTQASGVSRRTVLNATSALRHANLLPSPPPPPPPHSSLPVQSPFPVDDQLTMTMTATDELQALHVVPLQPTRSALLTGCKRILLPQPQPQLQSQPPSTPTTAGIGSGAASSVTRATSARHSSHSTPSPARLRPATATASKSPSHSGPTVPSSVAAHQQQQQQQYNNTNKAVVSQVHSPQRSAWAVPQFLKATTTATTPVRVFDDNEARTPTRPSVSQSLAACWTRFRSLFD
jgi:hypothetical protein